MLIRKFGYFLLVIITLSLQTKNGKVVGKKVLEKIS